MTNLHPLTKQLQFYYANDKSRTFSLNDCNNIIIEEMTRLWERIVPYIDLCDREKFKAEFHLPVPDTLEEELAEKLNNTPVYQGSTAEAHAKAAIAYLREKDLLR